jgi:hypothetical protein
MSQKFRYKWSLLKTTFGITIIVILVEVAVAGDAQGAEEVIIQDTISLFARPESV